MLDVSVVMSIYDEPSHVQKTVDSVLAQHGINFEFVIISDGASEAVLNVVRRYLDDPRVRLIEQENQGLTKALINGCHQAQAPYIARIDAGDEMLEGRLALQNQRLNDFPDVGIVASWVEIRTLEDYFLYQLDFSTEQLNRQIRASSPAEFRSPFHASVMFRKSMYQQAGGYRAEFYFAQDCDLWCRMLECCELQVIEKSLTKGIFSDRGISGKYAYEQQQLLSLILQARELRANNQTDKEILEKAYELRPSRLSANRKLATQSSASPFDGLYFVAKILTNNRSKYAFNYWVKVLKCRPLSIKSWLFSIKSLLYIGRRDER